MAAPPTSPPQPPAPQQPPTVLAWLQQLPPWLPPLLWLAGGGTLGAGGLELAGIGQQQHPEPPPGACVQQVAQLHAVTLELAQHLATCERTCARD